MAPAASAATCVRLPLCLLVPLLVSAEAASLDRCLCQWLAAEGFLSQDVNLGTSLKSCHLMFPNFIVPLSLNWG